MADEAQEIVAPVEPTPIKAGIKQPLQEIIDNRTEIEREAAKIKDEEEIERRGKSDAIRDIREALATEHKNEADDKAKQEAARADEAEKKVAESEIDEMTGLLTPDATYRKMGELIEMSERSGIPITLILGDLNFLKRFNDEHGHTAGDEVLKTLGERLKKVLREVDAAGRIGGDEFLIALYNTRPEEAPAFWKRLDAELVQPAGVAEEGITMSGGAALLERPPEGKDFKSIKDKADTAMYVSKSDSKQNNTRPRLVIFNNMTQEQLDNIENIKKSAETRAEPIKFPEPKKETTQEQETAAA